MDGKLDVGIREATEYIKHVFCEFMMLGMRIMILFAFHLRMKYFPSEHFFCIILFASCFSDLMVHNPDTRYVKCTFMTCFYEIKEK